MTTTVCGVDGRRLHDGDEELDISIGVSSTDVVLLFETECSQSASLLQAVSVWIFVLYP